MTNPQELYEELVGSTEDEQEKNFERVSDCLIDMVILACDFIAEQVNCQCADEQINWLLDQGFSPEEIKEFVGRVDF